MIADTASPKISPKAPKLPQIAPSDATETFTLTFAPDPAVFDGSFANNAWLQECPAPFTKQVWGNALYIAEADARDLNLVDGDVVRLTVGQRAIEAPVSLGQGRPTARSPRRWVTAVRRR